MPPYHEEEKIGRLRRAMYSRKYTDDMGLRGRREFDPDTTVVPEDWKHEDSEKSVALPLEAIMRPPRPSYTRNILKWAFFAALTFFVCAVAFFVYYLYFGGASAISARNIDIAISGPSQIAGGELANIEVSVTNRNREDLELAELIVTFPPGTRLKSDICTAGSCRVSLGTMPPGTSNAVKFPAVYAGGAGQHATVSAELEYRLGRSNSIFVASSDYSFVFISSPLSISVDGNTQAVSGQQTQMTVTVSSNANQPIYGVLLSMSSPFGFKLASSEPRQDQSGVWDLGTIFPGISKTITINGILSGEIGDNRIFQFVAGTKMSATSTSVDAPLADTSLAVNITRPFLDLAFSVNGKPSSRLLTVAPGDTVRASVSYKNNLSTAIQNAVIVARLSGLAIDGSSVHGDDGFYRSTDNSVIWDKTTAASQLTSIPAGDSGMLGFTFQIPSSVDLQGIENPVLDISVSAAGARIDEKGVPENLQSTANQKIVVASELQITAQGRYFTDPFNAAGPMPPRAESETTYAIVFTITNTTNMIKNAVVTAALPPYVRLAGNNTYQPASEKANFDSRTGLFTWQVGDIAPGAGLGGSDPRQIIIEVGLTPSTSQIGSEPVLVQNIKVTGVDASTDLPITKNAKNVTTNIVGDPGFSSINAKVVK